MIDDRDYFGYSAARPAMAQRGEDRRLAAVGHHRVSLNRSFTETSIWDAAIPAGKGGS